MTSMPELFDTAGLRDDAEHWDAMAAKVAAGACRRSNTPIGLIGRSNASLVVAIVVLLIAGLWTLSPAVSRSQDVPLAQFLTTADGIGQQMLAVEAPPPVADLLFVPAGRRR